MLKNMGFVVTDGARLLDGALGSSYDELLLDGLDPEARRIVGQVRNQGHEGPTWVNGLPTFRNLAIEVGNHGDEQVRWVFPPEFFEQPHHGAME